MNLKTMKKSILTLVVVLSFFYTFSASQIVPEKIKANDIIYIEEEEEDEPFNFDYKAYLPEGFNPYDLADNDVDATLWVAENKEDEPFDFNHKKYLPVGFNPSKEFNSLFLDEIKWVDEEKDELFDFDTKIYFNKSKGVVLVTSNL